MIRELLEWVSYLITDYFSGAAGLGRKDQRVGTYRRHARDVKAI